MFYTFLTIVILVSLLFVIDSKLAKDERTARQEAIKKEETSRGARPSLESIFWPQHNKQSLEAILGTNKIEKGGPISRFFSKLLN